MDDLGTAFEHLRALALPVVPEVVEGTSYGVRAPLVDGKALIGVSPGAHHPVPDEVALRLIRPRLAEIRHS